MIWCFKIQLCCYFYCTITWDCQFIFFANINSVKRETILIILASHCLRLLMNKFSGWHSDYAVFTPLLWRIYPLWNGFFFLSYCTWVEFDASYHTSVSVFHSVNFSLWLTFTHCRFITVIVFWFSYRSDGIFTLCLTLLLIKVYQQFSSQTELYILKFCFWGLQTYHAK